MSRLSKMLHSNKTALHTKSARIGGYSFFISVIMLAIVIGVNILAAALPASLTQFDISAARLYSVTAGTKAVAQKLTKDVDIYWIVQSGKEDEIVEKLLNVYAGLSDHIRVTRKDPDVFPTFAKEYTDETVKNNSLVVKSGDTYRYISYNDLYEYDTTSYYSYYQSQSVATAFDGEGEITAAIDYVVSEDLPKLYYLEGHGEIELSDTFSSAIEKSNILTEALSLLKVDELPEDAAAILINAPESDISEEEAKMLKEYLAAGGRVMILSGPQPDTDMANLKAVIEDYGVSFNEGIVVEGNRSYYAFSQPYILLPEIQSTEITDTFLEGTNYVIAPLAQGMTIDPNAGDSVKSLLSTSDYAFSKSAGYDLETYEQEEGDIDGPFELAVAVEGANSSKLIWVATDYLCDDTYNSYSSGVNVDFAMNSISWMIGENENITIRSKSLEYNYLTISESSAGTIKLWLIGIIPAMFLIYGICAVVSRRKGK